MILTCPKCSARFLVDDAALRPAGREVRCGRCRHQWFAPPPESDAEALPVRPAREPRVEPKFEIPFDEPRPAYSSAANLPALPRRRRRPVRAVLGWILFGLVVLGIGFAVVQRDRIVAVYPAARAVFGAFGLPLPSPGEGLQISDLTSSRTIQDGVPILVSEGRITNTTQAPRRVPGLRGALRDASGQELQSWTFTAPQSTLAPGASVPFRVELRQPATQAAELSITFQGD